MSRNSAFQIERADIDAVLAFGLAQGWTIGEPNGHHQVAKLVRQREPTEISFDDGQPIFEMEEIVFYQRNRVPDFITITKNGVDLYMAWIATVTDDTCFPTHAR